MVNTGADFCMSNGVVQELQTTPAVIVDVGIGRPVYTTDHRRRPSVPRRRGTNTEQSTSRSNVIKFPANLHHIHSWRRSLRLQNDLYCVG